ncbi:MAG: DEAD/DEAH box helicase [Phycisphaerales bacterium]|jgi:ATP-dependent RNA helicase RhlE
MSFSELNLASPIADALRDEGYTTPTPIQAQAIPPIMLGKDVLGCAQTGTGKTAAFALPILDILLKQQRDPARRGPVLPRVLVLSPTRELATQITDSFEAYGRHTGLSHTAIFGGVSQFHQVRAMHRGVDILVATPGRLMDLMGQGLVNLSAISIFVLDEADRMLDMGFIQPIRRIASQVSKERQTLMFSATMPKEIMHLADSLLRSPVKVAVTPVASAAPLIEQSVYMIARQQKRALLMHFLEKPETQCALVFTRTKHGADKLMKGLVRLGVVAQSIHGNKSQSQRQRALDSFRSGRAKVLVATDVAARGLDVDGVTHVFNYELPDDPESYVHRIGRTGRAGATGLAISFCDHDERVLLRDIERLTGKRVPLVNEIPELKVYEEVAEPREMDRRDDRAHYGQRNGNGRGNFGGGRPRQGPPATAPRGPAPAQGWQDNRPARNASLPQAENRPVQGNHPNGKPQAAPGHRGGPARMTIEQLNGEKPAPRTPHQPGQHPHAPRGGHRGGAPSARPAKPQGGRPQGDRGPANGQGKPGGHQGRRPSRPRP